MTRAREEREEAMGTSHWEGGGGEGGKGGKRLQLDTVFNDIEGVLLVHFLIDRM